MSYWIFIATNQETSDGKVSGRETYDLRMEDEFWGLGQKTPNLKHLDAGDRAVFYIGSPDLSFAGTATLASKSFALSEEDKQVFGHNNEFYTSDFGVRLSEVQKWEEPKSAKKLVPHLPFIENKEYWGAYFQGGITQISEADFLLITGEISSLGPAKTLEDIERENEFALESHLEDFLFKNWNRVDWGSKLKLFATEDQSGRQFPVGKWRIDFLALDKETGDLVVIELKRGKSSDEVVGQTLRYIAYVKENLAEKEQNVRGIIVAHEFDEALYFSLKETRNIEAKVYKVNFFLAEPESYG